MTDEEFIAWLKESSEWRVEINERLARLETKMNLIAYVAGASYGAVALTLITVVWIHL